MTDSNAAHDPTAIPPLDFDSGLYLQRLIFGDLKTQDFTKVVEEHGHPTNVYWQMQKQIQGNNNLTVGVFLLAMKMVGDFTPLEMAASKLGIKLSIQAPHKHTPDVVREFIESVASDGQLAEKLNAVSDTKALTKRELIELLDAANKSRLEKQDIASALMDQLNGKK